jgi:DNA-binding transcriptional MerR regulator
MDQRQYSIGEVAEAFGIRTSALRYYDTLGVLKPAGRRSGARTYGIAELRLLALIQLWHHAGSLNLDDTAAVISGRAHGGWRDVVSGAVTRLEQEIERLDTARRVLEHSLQCPRDNPVRDCPVLAKELDQRIAELFGTAPDHRRPSSADR